MEAEAEAMYLRAFQGYKKTRGEDRMSTLTMVNNLKTAEAEAEAETEAEAEAMYLRALQG